jgi:putative membrane protein
MVGLIGLLSPYKPLVASLTPVTLLLSFGLLLYNHPKLSQKWIGVLGVVFLAGFGVEVLGVKTGFPFGNYAYHENLGPKLFDVPLMIGINWAMLIYCSGQILRVSSNPFIQSAIGATFMLFYDMALEPSAIELNFWQWENNTIPIENYAAWFFIAFVLHVFVEKVVGSAPNKIAKELYFIQLIFFSILNFA